MVEEEAEATITILMEVEMVDILTVEPQQLDLTLTAPEIPQELNTGEQDQLQRLQETIQITILAEQEIIIILHQEAIVLLQEAIIIQLQEATITIIQLQEVLQEVVLEAAHQEVEVVLAAEDLEVVEVN